MDNTSMKPQPDLLIKAGTEALGNGMGGGGDLNTIEAALQSCQDMADHVVLVFLFYDFIFLSLFSFLFFLYCPQTMWKHLSSVGSVCRSLRDEGGEESANERPRGRQESWLMQTCVHGIFRTFLPAVPLIILHPLIHHTLLQKNKKKRKVMAMFVYYALVHK